MIGFDEIVVDFDVMYYCVVFDDFCYFVVMQLLVMFGSL